MTSSRKNIIQLLFICLLFLFPMVAYWWLFNQFAVNAPHWDDYAVKHSVERISSTSSFSERISLLFAQHNEHRIFLTRITAFFLSAFDADLNFKWLMIIGSLALFGIVFVFYKILKKYNFSFFALIPILFLLLGISLYENTFWGMASVQNFGVILLAFITFYLLSIEINSFQQKEFYWAIGISFLGIFTSSNGILIPIIGGLIMLFQRKKQAFWVWSGISVLFLGIYFYSYEKPLDISPKGTILTYLKGFLVTLGAGVELYPNTFNKQDFSMALGLFLLVFGALFAFQVLFKKYNSEHCNSDVFLLACLVFIGVTCLGVSVGRSGYGLDTLVSSKYKIYSLLAISIFYVVGLTQIRGSVAGFVQIATLLSVGFYVYSFFLDYENIRFQHQERVCDELNIDKNRVQKFIENVNAETADSLKIEQTPTTLQIENSFKRQFSLQKPMNGYYVYLKSDSNAFLFPTRLIWASKKDFFGREFIENRRVAIQGFKASLAKVSLKSGFYNVEILKVENDQKRLLETSQNIDIQAVKIENSKQNW